MIKRTAWFFLAAVCTAALSHCTEVEHCVEGETGCLGGPPDGDNCFFDLEVDRERNECVKPGSGSGSTRDGGTQDGGAQDGGTPDGSTQDCECQDPEVCAPDGTCINYCEPPEVLPGSEPVPTPIDCEAEPQTLESVCRRYCELYCRHVDAFCPEADACPQGFCDTAEALAACQDVCGVGSGPRCMLDACIEMRLATCEELACPDGEPECSGVTCTNECGTRGDGECDDGDLASAQFGVCDWGTDCADCGPRRGPAPALQPYGGACLSARGCVGYRAVSSAEPNAPDLDRTEAWCLQVEGQAEGLAQCVPDCSRGQGCPAGYQCFEVRFDGEPIESDGYTSSGCVPIVCR